MTGDRLTLPLAILLGAFFVVWYLAGNEVMRRRARRLAIWCKRATDPLNGKQAIQWLTLHSFRLEIDAAQAPFRAAVLTGLTESWDVPFIWLWNRLNWRRDMVLLQAALREPPACGLELYRPRAVLASDAKHFAKEEGWKGTSLGEFQFAPDLESVQHLGDQLLEALGVQRANLIRLGLRRQGQYHLILALNMPDPAGFGPEQFKPLLERLIDRAVTFGGSREFPSSSGGA